MNTANLLVAVHTQESINRFLSKPSHALALLGLEGVGKRSLALVIASQALKITPDALQRYPYFTEVVAGGKAISIDTIRGLRSATSLKTLGKGIVRRVVLIVDAHLMTIEAQNALLKTLEEPPADTLLILTAIPDEGLLPTILSRLTTIRVELPSETESLSYFSIDHEPTEVRKHYIVSGGRPGVLASLLADNQEHPLVQAVSTAKQLVASEPFTRMTQINELAKDKATVDLLLDALTLVYRSLMITAVSKQDNVKLKKFHGVLVAINDLQEIKTHNPTTKLLLTDLMWRL